MASGHEVYNMSVRTYSGQLRIATGAFLIAQQTVSVAALRSQKRLKTDCVSLGFLASASLEAGLKMTTTTTQWAANRSKV